MRKRGGRIGPRQTINALALSGFWDLTTVQQEVGAGNWNSGPPMSVLIIAGGGAGGGGAGGGGGGGGYIEVSNFALIPGTYTVTVGAGGGYYSSGSNSSLYGMTAVGGGRASQVMFNGAAGTAADAGGSGGGGGQYYGSSGSLSGGASTQPSTTTDTLGRTYANTGFGNRGGNVFNTLDRHRSGGGAGGAGSDGDWTVNGPGKTAFNGGTYAAGGGSGTYAAGGANTGNGGGGVWNFGSNGVGGGSGIVVIQYPNTFSTFSSTTGSPTYENTGGFHRYTYAATGTFTLT